MITPSEFISNYREAFGEVPALPVVFYYSDECAAETPRVGGCMFKTLTESFEGKAVSFSMENLACGGGKMYAGFIGMPEQVPAFVSLKEKYKQTPEMVADCVKSLDIKITDKKYLNFVRVDMIESLEYVRRKDGSGTQDKIEGMIFFATIDVLSGLCAWTFFDTNRKDAVTAMWASGCSSVITMAVRENRTGGMRTFLGLFDPSVRPQVGENFLSFVIPSTRLATMLETMRDTCLFGSHAWEKVKNRINGR